MNQVFTALSPADWAHTPTTKRPWGEYTVLFTDDKCKIKKITVNPGCRLSLQSHAKRNEHWRLISGHWKIEVHRYVTNLTPIDPVGTIVPRHDKPYFIESANFSQYWHHVSIWENDKHRVEAVGDKPLVFIEIQQGEHFNEADIVIYEDDLDAT